MDSWLFFSSYFSPYCIEAVLDIFVATVDLVDVVNLTRSFGTHGRDEHRDTGTDIGAGHVVVFELTGVVVSDDHSAVRVTEDDLRAHINQFIHEEQTRLEHLLVNEHRPACLGSDHKDHGQQIRCQTRPGCISHREDRTIEEGFYLIVLLGGNDK